MADGANYRLGVDIGGTFTDAVLVDDRTGQVWTVKVLTTVSPDEGAVRAIDHVLIQAGVQHSQLSGLVHATTLASNIVLQRKGARVALLTTAGFEDTLRLRREVRYDSYDLAATFVDPLVPRDRCRGVRGRMLVDGTEYEPLDERDVRRFAGECRELGVESIAVCLLHSYRNAAHERRVAEILAEELGADFPVSLSSTVDPEIREYERMSTTVINAYVQPAMGTYQERLERQLAERGYAGKVFVMISSGGVTTTDTTARLPVRLLESGPVAGVLAASRYATMMGEKAVVALDIGGTTAKACLVRHGRPERGAGLEVARVNRFVKGSGIPVQVPSIDLIEIGAGGGSIAWTDALDFLQIGPESAESRPGPACYGIGGTEPTVTDANVVLHLLDPERFAGGSMRLDQDAAEAALHKVAEPLGLTVERCALAMIDLVNENMADAVRVHLAEHGQQPEATTMLASGGGGPLHAVAVCRKLGIPRVVVPARAGVLSAVGLLVAPPAVEFARSLVTRLDDDTDWTEVERVYREMEREAVQVLQQAGLAEEEIMLSRSAGLRWVGQTHELTVQLPPGSFGPGSRASIEAAYDTECERLYGTPLRRTVLEALTWRVAATGPEPLTGMAAPPNTDRDAVIGHRSIRLPDMQPAVVPVYDRFALPPGFEIAGPAIVEETESTCVIGPGDVLRIDDLGNIVITVGRP